MTGPAPIGPDRPRGGKPHRPETRARVLAALLVSSKVEDAARAAGVARSTVRAWLAEPDFGEALAAARREALERAVNRLSASSVRAAEALEAVAIDQAAPPGARVAAAGRLLDLALRAHELLDLGARLDALEARLADGAP